MSSVFFPPFLNQGTRTYPMILSVMSEESKVSVDITFAFMGCNKAISDKFSA